MLALFYMCKNSLNFLGAMWLQIIDFLFNCAFSCSSYIYVRTPPTESLIAPKPLMGLNPSFRPFC